MSHFLQRDFEHVHKTGSMMSIESMLPATHFMERTYPRTSPLRIVSRPFFIIAFLCDLASIRQFHRTSLPCRDTRGISLIHFLFNDTADRRDSLHCISLRLWPCYALLSES